MLPAVTATEFESIWGKCISSIKDLIKRLRYELKQFNLLETAARNEGLPVQPLE